MAPGADGACIAALGFCSAPPFRWRRREEEEEEEEGGGESFLNDFQESNFHSLCGAGGEIFCCSSVTRPLGGQ